MHERRQRVLLQAALSGKTFAMTPLEQAQYNRYREDMKKNPGVEWMISTSLPDSGIEMSYVGANGRGLTLDQVLSLSQKAESIIGILETSGIVCEDGFLTVAYDDMLSNEMEMKVVNHIHHLIIPSRGCAIRGQLEEQLSYGIAAYTMRNLNPDEEYVMKTLEEIVCRVLSVYILRKMKLSDTADLVLQNGGTTFKSESPNRLWERAGDTKADIRNISAVFKGGDVAPFLQLRDYVNPFQTAENRSLNQDALRSNHPDSEAVQLLCKIAARIESDSDDLADYMMSDPFPD